MDATRIAWVAIDVGSLLVAADARAGRSEDEAAIKALNDTFAAGFVAKDAKKRASPWAVDGTLVPPNAGFLQGRAAIEKHFESEIPEVTASSKVEFSNYRFDFIGSDLAFVDADLTIHDLMGPNHQVLPLASVKVVILAERLGERWWIRDERAHFPPRP